MIDTPHKCAKHLGVITPERVLYEFDEPLVFTAKLGLSDLLFLKVSEVDGRNVYLATSVYSHVLAAVEGGSLSLRGAMTSGPCFVMELADDGEIAKYWECAPDEIPEEMLPKRGVGLKPGKTSAFGLDKPETDAVQFSATLEANQKMSERREIDQINRMGAVAEVEFRRRSSLGYLECAVNLMASDFTLPETAAILRGLADDLEEFG